MLGRWLRACRAGAAGCAAALAAMVLCAAPSAAQESGELGAGDAHTCAVLPGGSVKCWGRQEQNQLAAGFYTFSTGVPLDMLGMDSADAMSGGYEFTCILMQSGQVKCFGYNNSGQLGTGERTCRFDEGAGDCALVEGLDSAVDIAAGEFHTCAALADGGVRCWGSNAHGQLGQGDFSLPASNVPVDVPGITGAFAVAAGAGHSCALVDGGSVLCWGRNHYGQLGTGAAVVDPGVPTPTAVAAITDAVAIAAGDWHTCVVHATGAASCWGHENYGALGNGEDTPADYHASPISFQGVGTAVSVAAGSVHTCLGLDDGQVVCVGHNWHGQVGNGENRNNVFVPSLVSGIATAGALAAGGSHTCARVNTDPVNVMCWGSGVMGEIGNGAVGGVNETPVPGSVVGSPFERIFDGPGASFEPSAEAPLR